MALHSLMPTSPLIARGQPPLRWRAVITQLRPPFRPPVISLWILKAMP